jgi:hypothetical protein
VDQVRDPDLYKLTPAQVAAREYVLSRFGQLNPDRIAMFLGIDDPEDPHVQDVINAVFDSVITVRWPE